MNSKPVLAMAAVMLILACCGPASDEVCAKKDTSVSMKLSDAVRLAQGHCTNDGALKATAMCNENTGTWWIDLDPKEQKAACPNPACVVNVETGAAETNWRCMGLIPPK